MNKRMWIAGMLVLFALGLVVAALAQGNGEAGAKNKARLQGAGQAAFAEKLTAEQRQQVMAKVKEMREKGAQPEEIRAAVGEMLKGWGIEMGPGQGKGPGLGHDKALMEKLTPEQREQLQAKLMELRAKNATPEETKVAVQELLKGWGIEYTLPEKGGPGEKGARGPGQGAKLGQLTPEQRQQVMAKIAEMRAKDAKPEEIRAAVQEMLKGWGIEAKPGEGQGPGAGRGVMGQLTPEQRKELQAKVAELRANNATPEEIKKAVGEMLKGWGIEAKPGEGQGPGAGRGVMGQLTPEQRKELQAKVAELRANNATPEEIKKAVGEMLKGWGIEAKPGEAPGRGEGQGRVKRGQGQGQAAGAAGANLRHQRQRPAANEVAI
jgi:Spy/CpxP family protein refolding chaperone